MYIYVCIYVYDRSFLLNSDRQKNLDKRLARVEKKNTHTHTVQTRYLVKAHTQKGILAKEDTDAQTRAQKRTQFSRVPARAENTQKHTGSPLRRLWKRVCVCLRA